MDDLLQTLRELYPTGEPFAVSRDVAKGVLSVNKIVKSGNKEYFLKQYRSAVDKQKIKEVHAIKKHFFNKNIPVILPIENKNGSTYFKHGDHFYALFPLIAERQIERNNLSHESLRSLGMMLGKIHLAGKDYPDRIQDALKPWTKAVFLEKYDAIKKKLALIREKSAFDISAENFLEYKKSLVEKISKTHGDFWTEADILIHGDYHDGNVFFADDTDVITHVFDFEKAKSAPRAFELIRSLNYMGLAPGYNDEAIKKSVSFLKGYNKIFPISPDELREGMELWFIKMAYSLWIEGEYYLNNNSRPQIFFKDDGYNLRYFADHRNELAERLISEI